MANRPPLLNQLSLPDNQRSNDCGETAVAALLQAGGFPDTPMEEISDLNHNGSTQTGELSQLLRDNGAVVTPISGQWPVLLSAGDAYALVLIRDNSNADPDPNGAFRHYVVAYAIDPSGGVRCMNPWGGRDMVYDRGVIEAATVWVALVRFSAQQAGNKQPTGGTPQQELQMTPEQAAMLQEIHNTLFGGEDDSLLRQAVASLQSMAANVQEIHNTLFAGQDGSLLARIDANVQSLIHK
ncbi:MAG: hypothetical protein M3O28_00810 [Actinomycetota bacterium]|nr:hypothetical protein [Actinomycetota bacterium]